MEIQSLADIQSNRVLKKISLKSVMFLLMSPKLQAFLSLQIHQIMQFLCFPKCPCQPASKSTTDFGMTKYSRFI